MWFWFALTALICWSGSDLFSKIGCRDADDPYSHLKMVMAVGAVMGLHAAYEIFVNDVPVTGEIILTYLPVSALYILSMAIGYLGLRYIELSISSPICNSSGAIVAILTLITAGIGDDLPPVALVAVALVCVGVIALGWVESREDEELRRRRQDESNYHYAKSALAIAIPVIYCLLDALGTFADSRVLDRLGEELADACNVAYELTFLAMGIVCAVYVLIIKKQRLIPKREIPKVTGAVFETAGQFFYIYALADTEHVAFSAPIISSYCVASVLWSRLFLKEKLSKKHYACITLVVAGIIIMGILDI
ncbi:MAG: DMT family transporter [Oscillospiraceae bacterium]|nr:DMT family transporter [Oscillospiraceae bacterium]